MNTDIKLNPVQATLRVDSKQVHFVYMRVNQEFYSHQNFEVHLNYEALEDEWMSSPERTIELMGKQLTIEFYHEGANSNSQVFTGIITSTEMQSTHGGFGGIIILKGYSPSILLDRGKNMEVYNEVGFKTIVNDIKKEVAQDKLDFICDPQYTEPFNLVYQYNESDFDFINRLAATYNEWFHYTGTELVLGKPDERPATELIYDKHLSAIQMQSQLLPAKFSTYNYNAEKNLLENSRAAEIAKGTTGFTKVSAEMSNESYTKEVIQLEKAAINGKNELDKLNEGHKAKLNASMLLMKGVSSTSEVRIGRLISVKLPETMTVPKDLGEYRVISVLHEVDEAGRYTNMFNAVPSALNYIPSPKIETPQAYPQLAEVIDNEDEKGMGRVQIKFHWQKEIIHSPWVRVQAPDAGSSDKIAKNRGFVFIPEKGDQVMVGFEHGDSSRPFVMGSMFHGKNAEGGGTNNSVKSIITKSGHTIELNDDEKGNWGIMIKDYNGNLLHINTASGDIVINANKNITVNAGETMTLNAKNLNVNIQEEAITSIGSNQKIEVGGDTDISTTNKKEAIAGNYNLSVDDKLTEAVGEASIISDSGDIVIKSAGKALLQGATDARVSKG